MSYEDVSRLAQQGGTLYFVVMFIGGLVYAFWPKKRAEFDRAARIACDEEEG